MRVNLRETDKVEFMRLCSGLKTEQEDVRSDSDLSNAYDHFYEAGLDVNTRKKGNRQDMIMILFNFVWRCSEDWTEREELLKQEDFVGINKLFKKRLNKSLVSSDW